MIRVFFGSPGAGKTTLAVKHARFELSRRRKYYDFVFLNFKNKIPGAHETVLTGLGSWSFPEHSYILIDEAGIEYNNRSYKALPKETIEWFKLHRHYRCDVDVFSQSWEDMDITLRRLATDLWYIKKIGPFTICRRVFKRVTVNKETEQIIDGYRKAHVLTLLFPFFGNWSIIFRPFHYRFFDSYEHPQKTINYGKPSSPDSSSTCPYWKYLYSRATALVIRRARCALSVIKKGAAKIMNRLRRQP